MTTKPQAVIEIGSTGIRLLVAEITDKNKRYILDRSELPVALGRDVFTTGTISRETLLQCLHVMNRFGEQLDGWGITREETTVIATRAVREANNRDPFVDRIKVATGFNVHVIDGIEENRLMYIAVTDCLQEGSVSVQQSNSIILEITGGTTEVMLMECGRMAGAHSMRLGTVIIEQQMRALMGNIDDGRRFIEEFIRNTRGTLKNEINLEKIQHFIAVGNDMKVASLFAGKPVSSFLWEMNRNDFDRFVDEVQHYTIEECVARFKLSYSDSQTFQISLLAYKLFINLTNVHTIIVPETSIREGLLISTMMEPNKKLQLEFNAQITASAQNLLKKYQGDEAHAEYVRGASIAIYDALRHELGLDGHARVLLEVSAILHDIGMFIRAQDHNKHSRYIITHSEVFGLSHDDVTMVAQIANYHKGSAQPQEDPEIWLLPRKNRLTILKLSAILRVADALDRGHQQNLTDFTIHLAKDTITFRVKGHRNLNLEKLAMAEKGELFENVFGYKIVLV
ncbi:MAG: HD domain-containing protein [Treponema sp.]|nr:HD domain-containing protein [Treponema sp.]